MFMVSNGKLVSAEFGCGISAAEMASSIPSDMFLVAPRK